MATRIKSKANTTSGAVPVHTTNIIEGELAINTADQILYSANGTTVFAVAITNQIYNWSNFH